LPVTSTWQKFVDQKPPLKTFLRTSFDNFQLSKNYNPTYCWTFYQA
jgi:hypothetical protein